MSAVSKQKNPILDTHWDESQDAYVTKVRVRRRAIRIRVPQYTWITDWFGAPFSCHCPKHVC